MTAASPSSTFEYTLQEATVEDLDDIAAVEAAAFADDGEFNTAFPPSTCPPQALHAWRVAQHRASLDYICANSSSNASWKKIIKAVDSANGRLVGWAAWQLGTADQLLLDEDADRDDDESWPEGSNKDACRVLFGGMKDKHRRHLPTQLHLYTPLLAVDPAFARRGIASKLVRWGTQRADASSWPCYIEATSSSLQIYKRLGYQEVDNAGARMTPDFVSDVPVLIRHPSASAPE